MIASLLLATGFMLAGETVRFDAELRPRFTPRQLTGSAASTRAGLEKWARTAEGRAIIARFREGDREITITEDETETGVGRAPQPGFATLLTFADRTKPKYYELILNPALADAYRNDKKSIDLGQPKTAADVMAAAWAAEMLHIDFYGRGIPLPHHDRADFQERWQLVAAQLGFPVMQHGDEAHGDGARLLTIGEEERRPRSRRARP